MDFQVWDIPAGVSYLDAPDQDIDGIFSSVGALIWVIDAQDEYFTAIQRLNDTILYLCRRYHSPQHPDNPFDGMPHIEVFVHKVDGLSDDFRADVFRDIQQRILDDVADHGFDAAPIHFYSTSIYDATIFEAFSKVIQRLVPQLPALENLLNGLCSKTGVEKAYLFDVCTKIYIASDTTPGDITQYETCSDLIDVVVDISEIYGWERPDPEPGSFEEKMLAQETGNSDAEAMITMERRGAKCLYLREVNKYLALVCIMAVDDPAEKRAMVEYNMRVFARGVNQVFEVRPRLMEDAELKRVQRAKASEAKMGRKK
ncbi:hypothetical protein FH972_025075 [Carpinus fangiana]|nr:hypothetical protein FH972_025075 [Carpinus fangiana]